MGILLFIVFEVNNVFIKLVDNELILLTSSLHDSSLLISTIFGIVKFLYIVLYSFKSFLVNR